jgi:hypothetical protein
MTVGGAKAGNLGGEDAKNASVIVVGYVLRLGSKAAGACVRSSHGVGNLARPSQHGIDPGGVHRGIRT